jgi:PrtD family type I secretion system ABC transporter
MRPDRPNELSQALGRSRGTLAAVGLFSAVVNILMLTGTIFMLQVYDRVLASGSKATLLILVGLVIFLYGLMGLLDHIRSRALARVGADLHHRLDDRVFRAVLRQAEHPALRDRPASGLRDLNAIQHFFASATVGSFFDLPWTPVYLALLYLFQPMLGWAAVAGGLVVIALAILNQRATRLANGEAASRTQVAEARTETLRKGVETAVALGMDGRLGDLRAKESAAGLEASVRASDAGGGYTVTIKTFRLLLQSLILALGAYLVLIGELGAGAMIAGTTLMGRALAPIEQCVGQWSVVQKAWMAWHSLRKLLDQSPKPSPPMDLPKPQGRLSVRGLSVAAPGDETVLLRDVSLEVNPGQALAVIGPSGSGKTTLARALVGLWPANAGEIRLDGAELCQFDRAVLGGNIGYLPQEVVLFAGTVAQNIARFDPAAKPEEIVAAARAAAAHELILSLLKGYDTEITNGGTRLSGGQRQRIGLARAVFGEPALLVLDEPNSALDDQGMLALNTAVANAKQSGKSVVLMSHRPASLADCDLLLVLDDGRMRAFGQRDEVLSRIARNAGAIVSALRPKGNDMSDQDAASRPA